MRTEINSMLNARPTSKRIQATIVTTVHLWTFLKSRQPSLLLMLDHKFHGRRRVGGTITGHTQLDTLVNLLCM
eukprot:2054088-Amphidinium_carterae.1